MVDIDKMHADLLNLIADATLGKDKSLIMDIAKSNIKLMNESIENDNFDSLDDDKHALVYMCYSYYKLFFFR